MLTVSVPPLYIVAAASLITASSALFSREFRVKDGVGGVPLVLPRRELDILNPAR